MKPDNTRRIVKKQVCIQTNEEEKNTTTTKEQNVKNVNALLLLLLEQSTKRTKKLSKRRCQCWYSLHILIISWTKTIFHLDPYKFRKRCLFRHLVYSHYMPVGCCWFLYVFLFHSICTVNIMVYACICLSTVFLLNTLPRPVFLIPCWVFFYAAIIAETWKCQQWRKITSTQKLDCTQQRYDDDIHCDNVRAVTTSTKLSWQ